VFQGSGPGPGQQSLWQRAANSLYVEYLHHQNYGYALSVFQPECGLTNQQVMTRDELARVLGLGPTSSVVQYMPTARSRRCCWASCRLSRTRGAAARVARSPPRRRTTGVTAP
jgi:hypothetical protein